MCSDFMLTDEERLLSALYIQSNVLDVPLVHLCANLSFFSLSSLSVELSLRNYVFSLGGQHG